MFRILFVFMSQQKLQIFICQLCCYSFAVAESRSKSKIKQECEEVTAIIGQIRIKLCANLLIKKCKGKTIDENLNSKYNFCLKT